MASDHLLERRDESMLTPQEVREELREVMISNYIQRLTALHDEEEVTYSMFAEAEHVSEEEQKIKVGVLWDGRLLMNRIC